MPLLQDIRVLDLSRLLPGPFCTLYLAQLGAEVIKIEEPRGGDYARTLSPELFALVNRGKKSVTLDLRKPQGVEVFRQLTRDADIVLESFRPGVMDRLGVGYDALKTVNPRLVFGALTGYGQNGPYRDRAGHDMNYAGYVGALHQSGTAGGPPAPGNFQVADLAGGALTMALGLVAALLRARSSGQGAFVDVGMLDGTLALQTVALGTVRALGHSQPRGQDMLSGGLPNYSVYECADGGYVALAALEPKFFFNFCSALNRPDLARLPLAPGAAGEPLRAALTELFRSQPRDHWERQLADKDCCVSAVLSPEEVLRNPQVQARGMLEAAGGKPAWATPIKLAGEPPEPAADAPVLGADTDTVLAAAGVDADARASLRADKVI